MKQLPGIFVLMSRKRKKDYKRVLQQILRLLPSPPVAERLVADFEETGYGAIKIQVDKVKYLTTVKYSLSLFPY
jgi:hypothetical protein